ncbi:MAG: hypothetical protein ALECFALPRED_010885 [Alectoria fallacina]|uniref:Uncharacterized protein n=1 Tax=Alectoria fallacina TaxID=1903189 RepID=A0A8H3IFN5_9LECA|nr:MAG: hypothetical protein ALECFALPRED_010885 [Alectoria fallacina]
MARTQLIIRKSGPGLRSAPIPGAGVVRKSKHTMSNNTTIFRLLKVPKYAKRAVASMSAEKNAALMEEVGRLKKGWMEQEREIEGLRKELARAEGELKALKEEEEKGYKVVQGQSQRLTREEEEEMEALWACFGK